MTLPATMVSSLASVRAPGTRPASPSSVMASSSGTSTRSGTGHGGRAGRDDVGDRGVGGDLRGGDRIGADDVARDDGLVARLGARPGHQAGVAEQRDGLVLGHIHEVGHGHGGRAGRDDVGDRGVGGDLRGGDRIGADDVARDDGLVARLGAAPGTRPASPSSVMASSSGTSTRSGTGHGGRAGRDDVGDRGVGGDLRGGDRIGADDVARDDGLVAGLGARPGHQAGVAERVMASSSGTSTRSGTATVAGPVETT